MAKLYSYGDTVLVDGRIIGSISGDTSSLDVYNVVCLGGAQLWSVSANRLSPMSADKAIMAQAYQTYDLQRLSKLLAESEYVKHQAEARKAEIAEAEAAAEAEWSDLDVLMVAVKVLTERQDYRLARDVLRFMEAHEDSLNDDDEGEEPDGAEEA